MENIYGKTTTDATESFENAKRIKLFSGESDNLEIVKKIEAVTVELCIKCEDIIEAFYQCQGNILFSKDKDAFAKKLLYNALVDSKEKYFGKIVKEREESVSYYKKTITELTAIIEELKQENSELVAENKELINKVKTMEEERTQIFEWIKGNPVKMPNEQVIKKLTDLENLSNRKGLYSILKRLQEEENANNRDANINNKDVETTDIDIDKGEK